MTTIAYDGNMIAYDSRLTAGNIIVDDDDMKRIDRHGYIFFILGNTDEVTDFLKLFKGNNDADRELSISAIVYIDGDFFKCGVEDKKLWKCPIRPGNFAVLGSGSEFALAAMDCEKNAVEAVEIAMGRDVNTGGRIRTFEIP